MSEIPTTTAALIEERIAWLDAEMEASLSAPPSGSPELPLYRWARYHLGWCDERLADMSPGERRRHGGKRLRGVLTVLTCEAMGGSGRQSAPTGAAIEFVHNFSLVHDDVEDNDAERRHRPTVWKLWGVPHAINVGSNMQALVDAVLFRLSGAYPPETVLRVLQVVNAAVVQMTEGQYLDMAAQGTGEMSLADYFRMTGGKTAALIEGALRAGALLGTSDEHRIARMGEFGRRFGLAFQCRDDYLGTWGKPELTGKPVGSDILSGKRSLPVVHALGAMPAGRGEGRHLRQALAARDLPVVLDLMERAGTPAFVAARVKEHTDAALTALAEAGPEGTAGEAIRHIADFALGRQS